MGHVEDGTIESEQDEAIIELPCETYQKALEDVIKNYCCSEVGDCSVKIEAGSVRS